MSIPLSCPCGRSFNIKDDLAGRKIRCPACKSILAVPAAVLLEAVEDGEPAEALPVQSSRRAAIQAEPPEVLPARRRSRDDDDEEERRPVKRRPKLRRESSRDPNVKKQSGFGGINAGVGGGLLMILIAVVWFVPCAAMGVYFIYPPILAVIGVVAIIKGLVGSGD